MDIFQIDYYFLVSQVCPNSLIQIKDYQSQSNIHHNIAPPLFGHRVHSGRRQLPRQTASGVPGNGDRVQGPVECPAVQETRRQ